MTKYVISNVDFTQVLVSVEPYGFADYSNSRDKEAIKVALIGSLESALAYLVDINDPDLGIHELPEDCN